MNMIDRPHQSSAKTL